MVISSFFGEYRFLSNFWPLETPVRLIEDDALYYSVESAYQASKTKDKTIRALIAGSDAKMAKQIGKKIEKIPGFDDFKFYIMSDLVKQKFDNNHELRKKLIETGDAELIEGNNWGDKYWGQCPIGNGSNYLGVILMCLRDSYVSQSNSDE